MQYIYKDYHYSIIELSKGDGGTGVQCSIYIDYHYSIIELSKVLNCSKISIRLASRGSVNIPESCDFQSQFDLLNIIFLPFF